MYPPRTNGASFQKCTRAPVKHALALGIGCRAVTLCLRDSALNILSICTPQSGPMLHRRAGRGEPGATAPSQVAVEPVLPRGPHLGQCSRHDGALVKLLDLVGEFAHSKARDHVPAASRPRMRLSHGTEPAPVHRGTLCGGQRPRDALLRW